MLHPQQFSVRADKTRIKTPLGMGAWGKSGCLGCGNQGKGHEERMWLPEDQERLGAALRGFSG